MSEAPRLDFMHKHGAHVVHKNRVIFHDGAWMANDSQWGQTAEPAANPFERQKMIVLYHEIVLARALDKYREEHRQLEEQLGYARQRGYHPPDQTAFDRLKNAKEHIEGQLITNFAKAKAELERLTPQEVVDKRKQESELEEFTRATLRHQTAQLEKLKL
jgi:hypothetical protein